MKRRHLSGLGTSVPTGKAIFEAWERWMAGIAGLGMAFPCIPAYFNPCIDRHKNISLFSDSLSALKAIKAGKTDCRPNMLNDIYELVNIVHQNVTLVWIPSHQGITGNETADRGAKQATKKQFVDLDVNLELKRRNHAMPN